MRSPMPVRFPEIPSLTAAALCCLSLASDAADLQVTGISPALHAVAAPTAGPVAVDFDANVDPATVEGNFRVIGRWSGPVDGHFVVVDRHVDFIPDRPFFPGELVTVRLSRNLASLGGDALRGGYAWTFYTRSRPGSGVHSLAGMLDIRFPGEGLIQSYGVYAGDLDGDGAPDLSIPNEVSSDVRVFVSDGCGDFTGPVAHLLPVDSVPSSNEGADFDDDGNLDLAVGNIVGDSMSCLLGDGTGNYLAAVSYPAGNQPRGVAVVDADTDGNTDVVVANRSSSDVSLFLGSGDGTFGPATSFDAGADGETSIAAADADGDGHTDLFVGHIVSDEVTCLLGSGLGTFTFSSGAAIGGGPWQIAVGDVDGDAVVDVASCNFDTATAGVLRGNGSGGFQPLTTYGAGLFPLAVDLGDLEGDGDLDLVVSNFTSGTWSVFTNDGTGAFASTETLPATIAGSCATLVDYDRDGDVDIVGIDEIADEVFLYAQSNVTAIGIQPSSCDATLRIDNLAGGGGFGLAPPHPVTIGGNLYVGVTAPPGALYAVLYGTLQAPAILLDAGILSLFPPFLSPGGVIDAHGEGVRRFVVPKNLPPGASLVVQALVIDAGLPNSALLTNPEAVEFTP